MMLAGASLGYAPPEQYEKGNERVSARTDVFSLAAIVFECLTGKPAFPVFMGENADHGLPAPDRAGRGRASPPAPPRSHAELRENARNSSPRSTQELARATQPDPSERHGSIREFWDAVEPLLAPRRGDVRRPGRPAAHPEPTARPPASASRDVRRRLRSRATRSAS